MSSGSGEGDESEAHEGAVAAGRGNLDSAPRVRVGAGRLDGLIVGAHRTVVNSRKAPPFLTRNLRVGGALQLKRTRIGHSSKIFHLQQLH